MELFAEDPITVHSRPRVSRIYRVIIYFASGVALIVRGLFSCQNGPGDALFQKKKFEDASYTRSFPSSLLFCYGNSDLGGSL
jgi:hypothetical protein